MPQPYLGELWLAERTEMPTGLPGPADRARPQGKQLSGPHLATYEPMASPQTGRPRSEALRERDCETCGLLTQTSALCA